MRLSSVWTKILYQNLPTVENRTSCQMMLPALDMFTCAVGIQTFKRVLTDWSLLFPEPLAWIRRKQDPFFCSADAEMTGWNPCFMILPVIARKSKIRMKGWSARSKICKNTSALENIPGTSLILPKVQKRVLFYTELRKVPRQTAWSHTSTSVICWHNL